MEMWGRKALFLFTWAVGIVALVATLWIMRSKNEEEEEEGEDDDTKPQRKFKVVLGDNSHEPFVHLSNPTNDKEDELHPYGEEIRALVESPVLKFSDKEPCLSMAEEFEWVDNVEGLRKLAEDLSREREFAVDTEQHSVRSFLGFTSLVQISTYERDYLVDAIALHDDMSILRPVFANSSICKVFHGADSDILWLQRDFHIYVVNLFDTARACDVLGKPQRSLAYLLQTYCDISTNKAFQKSDWRQRPLSKQMLAYARTDAHFLLFIARKLYAELLQGEMDVYKPPLLELAMRRSHLLCLQLYEKDGLASSPAAAAASLISKHSDMDKMPQEASFRRRVRVLCEWRDLLARSEDESLRFVMSDAALVAVARECPLKADDVYRWIRAADDGSTSFTESWPSPSQVIKRHIDSLIVILKQTSDATDRILTVHETDVSNKKEKAFTGFRMSKRAKNDFKRMQFVKKFSCKGLVYENCRIYAGDGRLLCYCDRKKLDWYLQRDLAEDLNDDPPAIRLRFEPKGRPEDENNEFYIQSKSNQCVACGESSHYLRYRIIPSCYRQHFPEYLKSHRSHDIVLLCVDCHEKAHRAAEKYKHVIAAEFGIPLFARKIASSGESGGEESVIESEDGVPPLQLRNAAMALLCHGHDMPESRREELEAVISSYFGGREISEEDMKAAALVGIDARGQKRLGRRIDKVLKKKRPVPPKGEVIAVEEKMASKTSKISLLGHSLHGKKVVEQLWEKHGEEGIKDFIQRWRVVFVNTVHPKFLPTGWEVTHSGHREFGDHSVYRPKWLTRT